MDLLDCLGKLFLKCNYIETSKTCRNNTSVIAGPKKKKFKYPSYAWWYEMENITYCTSDQGHEHCAVVLAEHKKVII